MSERSCQFWRQFPKRRCFEKRQHQWNCYATSQGDYFDEWIIFLAEFWTKLNILHILVTLPQIQPIVSDSSILGHSWGVTFSISVFQRPGTVDSIVSSRGASGKRPCSILAFPRWGLCFVVFSTDQFSLLICWSDPGLSQPSVGSHGHLIHFSFSPVSHQQRRVYCVMCSFYS